jgi:hypothetical protein
MALVGAYVLAGCLITYEHDLPKALEQYEMQMRPFVTSAQNIGPGVPEIATPHSRWGIWTLNTALVTVSTFMSVCRMTGLGAVVGWVLWPVTSAFKSVGWLGGVESIPLPKYKKMKTILNTM